MIKEYKITEQQLNWLLDIANDFSNKNIEVFYGAVIRGIVDEVYKQSAS